MCGEEDDSRCPTAAVLTCQLVRVVKQTPNLCDCSGAVRQFVGVCAIAIIPRSVKRKAGRNDKKRAVSVGRTSSSCSVCARVVIVVANV